MRLTRDETDELMAYIFKVRKGQKPWFFSNSVFKRVYKHPKFNELWTLQIEIYRMLSFEKREDRDKIMKKTAELINLYLDN